MNNAFWHNSHTMPSTQTRKKAVKSSRYAVAKRERQTLELASKRPVTGKEISDMFGMNHTSGAKILHRLKDRGLVKKVGHRYFVAVSPGNQQAETIQAEPEVIKPAPRPETNKGLFLRLNETYQEYCEDVTNFAEYLIRKGKN